jgi:hypothetical protein
MIMRLVFLISPTDELIQRLEIESSPSDWTCETTAVVTPELHYEHHFEGWKKAWREKSKLDFIYDFSATWRDSDNAIGAVAKELDSADDPLKEFDRFWRIQQGEDVIEIASDWRPS